MATAPRGCPSGRCHVHVRNLDRGTGETWRTGILDTQTVVTAQCMFGVVGNSAKWDPGRTFVTAQRIFGGVYPLTFFHVSRRRPLRLPYCPAGARRQHAQRCAVRGPRTTLFQLSAAPPFLSTTPSPRLFSSQVVKSHMPVTNVLSVVGASGDVV